METMLPGAWVWWQMSQFQYRWSLKSPGSQQMEIVIRALGGVKRHNPPLDRSNVSWLWPFEWRPKSRLRLSNAHLSWYTWA